MAVKLTKANFKDEIIDSTLPVLVDFWAEWCGPCKMIAPVIEEISKELEGKVKVCKVNVDEEPELSAEFSVMSIPTLKIFKDGNVVETVVGFHDKSSILKLLGL